jgi:outer membrane protein TolC
MQAYLQYLRERERLAEAIHGAYWNALAAREAYDVNQRALARSRELLEINRKKFDDGLIDETEILAAEAALTTREVEVLARRDAVQQTRDLLLERIAVPVETWDEVEVAFPNAVPAGGAGEGADPWRAFETAREARADLAALRALKRSSEHEVEARRQDARGDLSVVGRIGRGDSDESLGDSLDFDLDLWSVGLQYSTSWSRSAEKAALSQARLRLRQVETELQAAERSVLLQCRLAARDLATSTERVAAAQRAGELHMRKLELEQEKLAQGRSNTRIVVDYQDDLEFAQLAYVDAVAHYRRDAVRFRSVQGRLLNESSEDRP